MMAIYGILNFIISLLIIFGLFEMIFKILTDAKIHRKHVGLCSIVTGLLFTIGKIVLAYYFGKTQLTSVYGAAGSIILLTFHIFQ